MISTIAWCCFCFWQESLIRFAHITIKCSVFLFIDYLTGIVEQKDLRRVTWMSDPMPDELSVILLMDKIVMEKDSCRFVAAYLNICII